MTDQSSLFSQNYDAFLNRLKERIRHAQVLAATALNREAILLYWQLGREILERQEREGWGAKVVDRLAKDLRREFPDVQGFSARNLKYMRAFAEAYPDVEIVQQLLHKLPWGHLIRLLDGVKDSDQRLWYAQQAIDDLLRHEDDQPTIGIILCKSKRRTTVEYALRNVSTPIAVSTHQLPDQLKKDLPSSEQLEIEIDTKLSEMMNQE